MRPDWNFGTVVTALGRPEIRELPWARLVNHAIALAEDEAATPARLADCPT
jgi:hypothetical protein